MSDIVYLADADLEAGVELTDTVTLQTFWSSPEAVRLLVYGARSIVNAAPAHDHDEDGGELLYLPILAHSFGTYFSTLKVRGIPIGPPVSGSFAPTTTNGITDKSAGHRLFCVAVTLPGGVLGVRCSLAEYHESAGLDTTLTLTLRPLSSVNFMLGVAPDEVSGDFTYTTVGATTNKNHSIDLDDLSVLGDPTLDREVEVALWLTSDVSATEEQRILDLEIIPLTLTATARDAAPQDVSYPALAVREVKAGIGTIGAQFAGKIREIYNGLNRGLWGSTPGLLPNGQPDRRRRFRETITAAHQHQGSLCPTSTPGEIFGDGACLKDTQSFGYIRSIGDGGLSAGTPPTISAEETNTGVELHTGADLTTGWRLFRWRRSIPAGCGELHIRVGLYPNYNNFDSATVALASVEVEPVAGGASIVTNLRCGPFVWERDTGSADLGFVELMPLDDVGWVPNGDLYPVGRKGWSPGSRVTVAERSQLQLINPTYRVTEPLRVQLTYPPARSSETYHATGDYDITMLFKMRDSAAALDTTAAVLWIKCETMEGY